MAAIAGTGTAGRGGWGYTLQTENLLSDPGPQGSLSQDLQRGAFQAHRGIAFSGVEGRNYRRNTPLVTTRQVPRLAARLLPHIPSGAMVPEDLAVAWTSPPNDSVPPDRTGALPPNMTGVSRADQLAIYRRKMGR